MDPRQQRSKSDGHIPADRHTNSSPDNSDHFSKGKTAAEKEKCKHEVVDKYYCVRCQASIPRFGSIVDTGNINTYIKVVYVDESKGTGSPNAKEYLHGSPGTASNHSLTPPLS